MRSFSNYSTSSFKKCFCTTCAVSSFVVFHQNYSILTAGILMILAAFLCSVNLGIEISLIIISLIILIIIGHNLISVKLKETQHIPFYLI